VLAHLAHISLGLGDLLALVVVGAVVIDVGLEVSNLLLFVVNLIRCSFLFCECVSTFFNSLSHRETRLDA
jgi:hypothetical protein